MKRYIPYFLLMLFAPGGYSSLHAQVIGRMYSLVFMGGTPHNNGGTINVFDPLNNSDSGVINLTGSNGYYPYGSLIQSKDGFLYGMVNYGGSHGNSGSGGVIFRYNLITGQDSVLYNFNNGSDANTAYGSLVLDTNGLMYGMSYVGGNAGEGAIFSFDPTTDSEKVLYSMSGSTLGNSPTGSLMLANNGLLYGTTSASSGGYGAIFSFNIINDSVVWLANFNNTDGNYPRGNLIQASNGLLYGLTVQGGNSGVGVLYSYNIITDTLIDLLNFTNGADGGHPYESLMQASDGNLYGTTHDAGAYGEGILFRYDINTDSETVVINFNDSTGYYSFSDVIQASDGRLYGNTNSGGIYGWGTIFSYDLSTHTEATLYSYNDTSGTHPYGDLLEVMSADASIINNACSNDSAGALSVTLRGGKPPYTYLWSNGATTDSISNLASGVYVCTITDSRGVSLSCTYTVLPFPITLSFNVFSPCFGKRNDSISVNIIGGSGPFTYTWSNGYTTDTIYYVPPGTYTCAITDAHGCPAKDTVVVVQSAPLNIDSYTIAKSTYPDYNNGSITVYVSGGIPPGDSAYYLYLWSNGGSFVDSLTNLDSGSYAVCVTSPYGCGSVCDSDIVVVTGMENLTNSGNIVKVYPVPSSGQITIYLAGNGFNNLQITDALGRRVYKQVLSPQQNDNDLHIDLSGLVDGMYILNVDSQQGVSRKKIIIQK